MKYLRIASELLVELPHLRTLMWPGQGSVTQPKIGLAILDPLTFTYAIPETHVNLSFILSCLVTEPLWIESTSLSKTGVLRLVF